MQSENQSLHNTNILLKSLLANASHQLTELIKITKMAEQVLYLYQTSGRSPLLTEKTPAKTGKPPPVIIRPADVAKVLNIHTRSGDRILRQIRQKEGLPVKGAVSVQMFAKHYGIPVQEVMRILTS